MAYGTPIKAEVKGGNRDSETPPTGELNAPNNLHHKKPTPPIWVQEWCDGSLPFLPNAVTNVSEMKLSKNLKGL